LDTQLVSTETGSSCPLSPLPGRSTPFEPTPQATRRDALALAG
jgi:hypothetical protein